MSIKKLVIALFVLVAVIAALWFSGVLPPLVVQYLPGQSQPQLEITGYASTEHGLVFGYPVTYELKEFPLVNEEANEKWTAITLADKEVVRQAEENGASEGPPLIAIQIFGNPTNQSAEEWVRTSRFSNFTLSVNGLLATTTVGGMPAVSYIYSGLYTSDVTVAAHNGKIYMFLVDWITPEDSNLPVFNGVMSSVQFI